MHCKKTWQLVSLTCFDMIELELLIAWNEERFWILMKFNQSLICTHFDGHTVNMRPVIRYDDIFIFLSTEWDVTFTRPIFYGLEGPNLFLLIYRRSKDPLWFVCISPYEYGNVSFELEIELASNRIINDFPIEVSTF